MGRNQGFEQVSCAQKQVRIGIVKANHHTWASGFRTSDFFLAFPKFYNSPMSDLWQSLTLHMEVDSDHLWPSLTYVKKVRLHVVDEATLGQQSGIGILGSARPFESPACYLEILRIFLGEPWWTLWLFGIAWICGDLLEFGRAQNFGTRSQDLQVEGHCYNSSLCILVCICL